MTNFASHPLEWRGQELCSPWTVQPSRMACLTAAPSVTAGVRRLSRHPALQQCSSQDHRAKGATKNVWMRSIEFINATYRRMSNGSRPTSGATSTRPKADKGRK